MLRPVQGHGAGDLVGLLLLGLGLLLDLLERGSAILGHGSNLLWVCHGRHPRALSSVSESPFEQVTRNSNHFAPKTRRHILFGMKILPF